MSVSSFTMTPFYWQFPKGNPEALVDLLPAVDSCLISFSFSVGFLFLPVYSSSEKVCICKQINVLTTLYQMVYIF